VLAKVFRRKKHCGLNVSKGVRKVELLNFLNEKV
jgi:hypothetical protein